MTVTISVLPGVQDALVTQLQTAFSTSSYTDTQVSYAHPGQELKVHDVYLGKATATENLPVARGPARVARQEDWDQEILVSVEREGSDVTAARSDAFGMFAVIENLLATSPTLGVAGVILVTPHTMDYRMGKGEGRQGWQVVLTVTVHIQGRLY